MLHLALLIIGAIAGAGPELTSSPDLLAKSLICSDDPGGEHEPVLLIHGTSVLPEENWGWNYRYLLARQGFMVCTVRLPVRSLGDIQVASEYVVHAIEDIHARTGRKVDILAHSQGGLEARWALRFWPALREMVDDVVTLGAPHHGAWAATLLAPFPCALPACMQMRTNSRFIRALNDGDETPGDVTYTSIWSLTDDIVQPAWGDATAKLDGAVNVRVQDVCPMRPVSHISLMWDSAVFALVVDAFTHPGGTDRARIPRDVCKRMLPDVDVKYGLHTNLVRQALSVTRVFSPVLREPELADYARGEWLRVGG